VLVGNICANEVLTYCIDDGTEFPLSYCFSAFFFLHTPRTMLMA